MRWDGQALSGESSNALVRLSNVVRSVQTPDFAGITFHEVLAKSALNHVAGSGRAMPFAWTINPYRGCSHSCVYCFARNTHTYLGLDAGKDFDNEIIVKINVAEVLARELARKKEPIPAVALGTNTDPYQRAEGRYRLMPGIIAALADSGTPFSILTKGTLLRRDLPLLVEASRLVPVDLAMSIAVAARLEVFRSRICNTLKNVSDSLPVSASTFMRPNFRSSCARAKRHVHSVSFGASLDTAR